MEQKVNILIDAYYILYKSIYEVLKKGTINDLETYLNTQIVRITETFEDCQYFFIIDSKPNNWRKNYYSKYKENRIKDKNLDWTYINKVFDKFIESLPSNINVIKIDGLEYDDIVYYINKQSNKFNYSNILITSDNDIRQTLRTNLVSGYINLKYNLQDNKPRIDIQSNSKDNAIIIAGLILNKLYKMNKYISRKTLKVLKNIFNGSEIKIVVPEYEIFEDIVSGKKLYNITGIFKSRYGKIDSNGQYIGIKGSQGLYKEFKKTYNGIISFTHNKFIENLLISSLIYKNIIKTTKTEQNIIKKNIKRNIILNYLSEETIPKKYYSKMKDLNKYFDNEN